jgi:hypothetical protein
MLISERLQIVDIPRHITLKQLSYLSHFSILYWRQQVLIQLEKFTRPLCWYYLYEKTYTLQCCVSMKAVNCFKNIWGGSRHTHTHTLKWCKPKIPFALATLWTCRGIKLLRGCILCRHNCHIRPGFGYTDTRKSKLNLMRSTWIFIQLRESTSKDGNAIKFIKLSVGSDLIQECAHMTDGLHIRTRNYK